MASIVRRFIQKMEEVGIEQIKAYIDRNQAKIVIIRRRVQKEVGGAQVNSFKYEVNISRKRLGWFTPGSHIEPVQEQFLADGEVIRNPEIRQIILNGLVKELREATKAGAYSAYLKEGKTAYDKKLEPSDIDPRLIFKSPVRTHSVS